MHGYLKSRTSPNPSETVANSGSSCAVAIALISVRSILGSQMPDTVVSKIQVNGGFHASFFSVDSGINCLVACGAS